MHPDGRALRLAAYALASLLAVPASGQLARHPPVRVVANLGTCVSTPGSTGPRFAIVTDGASSTDCAVGGGANIVPCWCDGSAWGVLAGGGGGGTSVALDLADDGANESAALTEIAVTGDTNSIFSEPAPDKLLIAVGANWPIADSANDLACTACVSAPEIDDGAAATTFALFSGAAGAASFRAITEADISDLGTYQLAGTYSGVGDCGAGQFARTLNDSAPPTCAADNAGTDDQVAAEVPFTPAGTIIATSVQAAIEEAASEAMQDGDPPTAHAPSHSLGAGDPVTATNLASSCTDAQVLGGTLAGTGVECQTDQDTVFTPNVDPGINHSGYVAGHAVQDEGVPLTQRGTVNFTGAGITCDDNGGAGPTTCDVAAGAAEVNDLEGTPPASIQDTEIFIGTGVGTGAFAPVSGDGTLSNAGVFTIGSDKVLEAMLKAVNSPTDEFCLTYELTTGDFEWQSCGGGGTPGGSDTQVQFNDSSAFGGDADLTWNKTTNILTLSNVGRLEISGTIGDLRLVDSNAAANIKRWAIRSDATAEARLRFGLLNDAESAWVAQDAVTLGVGSDGPYLQVGSTGSNTLWSPLPVAATCTDNGTGTPGALTLNPAGRLIHLTVADADGCTVTLSEASTRNGRISAIINVSANTATFSDTSAVSELSGAIVLGQWDILNVTYVTDRWVQMSVSDN